MSIKMIYSGFQTIICFSLAQPLQMQNLVLFTVNCEFSLLVDFI